MEVRAAPEVGEADTISSSDDTLSTYAGPVVPRVGGAMPETRPGWFRVPAPGGKDSKVCMFVTAVYQRYQNTSRTGVEACFGYRQLLHVRRDIYLSRCVLFVIRGDSERRPCCARLEIEQLHYD